VNQTRGLIARDICFVTNFASLHV